MRNRVDPDALELASRQLDADLSDSENRVLAGELAANKWFAVAADRLKRVHRLLEATLRGVRLPPSDLIRLFRLLQEQLTAPGVKTHLRSEVEAHAAAPFLQDYMLAMQAAEGRDEAWRDIIGTNTPGISALVHHYGFANEHEDIIQDIFLLICRRIGSFRGESSLKTWIFRVAVNFLNNYARRVHAKRSRELPESRVPALAQIWADTAAGPEEAFEQAALWRTIQSALAALDEDHRTAVVLKDLQDLSYREIADVLGIPEGTVKSRVARGRMALGEILLAKGVIGC